MNFKLDTSISFLLLSQHLSPFLFLNRTYTTHTTHTPHNSSIHLLGEADYFRFQGSLII